MHAGCPVLRGTKYSATKWIHVEPFGHAGAEQPVTCEDTRPECASWATRGECERNPAFMVGTARTAGACRLACGACRRCPSGDVLCERENARGAVAR